MGEIVRAADVFYKGRKVGYATGGNLEVAGNGEDQICAQGHVGVSVGPKTSKLTLNALVPVPGVGITVVSDMLQDKYVNVSVGILDGKIWEIDDMKCVSVRLEWDQARGTQSLTADFSGGKPTLTG